MFTTAATVLALASLASAQSQVTLLVPGFEQPTAGSFLGSVITSDASATTYSLAFDAETDSSDYGFPPSFTFTQGPATIAYTYDSEDTANTEYINIGCQVTSSTAGLCTGTVVYQITAGSAITSVTTTSLSGTDLGPLVVILTDSAALAAGAAATTAGASTTGSESSTSSGSSTGSGSASKTTGSPTGTAKTSTGSSTGSAATGASPKASTGGMPMITGAPWVVGGVAAAAMYAAI